MSLHSKISFLVWLSFLIFAAHSFNIQSKLKSKANDSTSQTQCSDSPPSGCVYLYTDYITKFQICGNTPNLKTQGIDKLALAIQIGPNTNVTLFSDYNYQGNQDNIPTTGYFPLSNFIGQTSSVGFYTAPVVVTYAVRGYIKNALTNLVFSSAQIQSGSVQVIFTLNSKNYSAAINAANSTYSIQLPAGNYTRWAKMVNMSQTTTNISVSGNSYEDTNANSVLFTTVITGWRAVLTWNTIQDLDTYCSAPGKEVLYYKKKNSNDGVVSLDIDNRNGTGPETMTFNFTSTSQGTYNYYVSSYSKLPLNQSQSKVVLYFGGNQVVEVLPPANNVLTYWNVFQIVVVQGGSQTYSLINTYTNTIPGLN